MAIKSSQTLVQEALNEIETISPDEALKLSKNNKCNFIDLKGIRELQNNGMNKNSQHISWGTFVFWLDPQSDYFKNRNLDKDKQVVLFGGDGLRSALVTKSLKAMVFENVFYIDGGFVLIKTNRFETI